MSEKQPALEGMPDFSAEVEALFVEKKLHRNHDLSVSQLAREIGTNRSYLSAWLNNTLGTNFCDFVQFAQHVSARLYQETRNHTAAILPRQTA